MVLVSMVMMGYMLVINWKDKEGFEYYFFVENLENLLDSYWIQKLWLMKMMFFIVMLCFKVGWDLCLLLGFGEYYNEVICLCYRMYLLWRLLVIVVF